MSWLLCQHTMQLGVPHGVRSRGRRSLHDRCEVRVEDAARSFRGAFLGVWCACCAESHIFVRCFFLTSVEEDWHSSKGVQHRRLRQCSVSTEFCRLRDDCGGNYQSYLFVCNLCDGTVSSSDEVVLNGRMGSE